MSRAKPRSALEVLLRAGQLHRDGKLAEAGRLYRSILATQPRHFEVLHQLAAIEYRLGRYAEAKRVLGRALKIKPADAGALSNLGLIEAALGDAEAALANYDLALAHSPDFVDALNNRGLALIALGRPGEALASFDRALALKPDFVEALNNRGNALRQLDLAREALEAYKLALAFAPNRPETINNRGAALRDLGHPEAALADHDHALALAPDFAEALTNRGVVLRDLNRTPEALQCYERALELEPNLGRAHENKSIALAELGRIDEAVAAIECAIAVSPREPRAYYNLTQIRRIAADEPHFQALQTLARQAGAFPESDQILLSFALAKACADQGDHAASFRHLLAGNALKRARTVYDEAATLGLFQRIRATFDAGSLGGDRRGGNPSAAPVFIVGMPRSGTTLVEQILAGHPEVHAAGETDELARAAASLDGGQGRVLHEPEAALGLPEPQIRQIAETYLARASAAAPRAGALTDKTLHNVRLIGLIRLALPNARIIQVSREPMDNCVSAFSRLFAGDLPYTYDLAELGRYCRAHRELMAHWRASVPRSVILDVQYEDVVRDLEGQARRIVGHCGLDWDDRCLDFHLAQRPVRTASATQVRQPIYPTSIGRWRALAPFLAPLAAELDAAQA